MIQDQSPERRITGRIRVAFFILLIAGIFLTGRLFFLQVVSGAYYKTQAQRQQNFSQILTPRRGEIYLRERSGELIPVATTKEGYLLFINPKKLKNPEAVLEKLSTIVTLDKEDFLSRTSKKDDPYEVVLHRLNRDTADKITDLKLENVGISPEEWRVYPAKTEASHVKF